MRPHAGNRPTRHRPPPRQDIYETVLDQTRRFDAWLKKMRAAELVAFDTETTSLDYMQAEIVGVSFWR